MEKKKAKYDDSETSDTDEAIKRLHEICKIHDEYRDIPTTLIDKFIIASNRDLTVDDAFVKNWSNIPASHSRTNKYLLSDLFQNVPKIKFLLRLNSVIP